jgi:hypothetical protein
MSTAFYEGHGILVCPDGDKLRSDEEGLFCVVDGDRVAAAVVNGVVTLQPPAPKSKKAPEGKQDGNG